MPQSVTISENTLIRKKTIEKKMKHNKEWKRRRMIVSLEAQNWRADRVPKHVWWL